MRKTDFYIMVWHRWYCAETLVCLVCFTNALTIRLTQNCASCSAVRHSKDFLAMPLGGVAASTDFNWRSSQTVMNEWRFPDLCLAWLKYGIISQRKQLTLTVFVLTTLASLSTLEQLVPITLRDGSI